MSIYRSLKDRAYYDADRLLDIIQSKCNCRLTINSITTKYTRSSNNDKKLEAVVIFDNDGIQSEAVLHYVTGSDDSVIYTDDLDEVGQSVADSISIKKSEVTASSYKYIRSAEDDLEDDESLSNSDEEEDSDDPLFEISDDSIEDNIDELSDQVEDLQDSIDEIRVEDPNIDIDNNINNHFIAECETCHGIFISAVVESDQPIESITGICPLCDRETTQYLRWVVKSVNNGESDA